MKVNNHLKISWRNLRKNKIFSLINIIGLAIGLSCFILIALYVKDEWSYDRQHEYADRIYRINGDFRIGGMDMRLATAGDPMGPTLKSDYPQVENYVRIYAASGAKLIKHDGIYVREERVAHADSTLFDVFSLPLLKGDARNALNQPNTVVISESTARRYFNSIDVRGRFIQTQDNDAPYQISAVMEDIPRNNHFHFDFIFSMENVEYPWGQFLSNNFQTYILLRPDVDYKAFEQNFSQVVDKYILPQARQVMDVGSMEEFNRAGNYINYSLMPLKNIHLHSSDRYPELGVNGSIQYVYIFSSIALFVLLLACINFMNLSTARSLSRAKEVSIRKILGTEKKALISQFLTESCLTTVLSLFIALLIVIISLEGFNSISGKQIPLSALFQPVTIISLLTLSIVVGILAGLYPALVIAEFKPLQILKSKIGGGFRKDKFRSSLVVFQFLTSIILIIGTMVIFRQLDYIQNKEVGFDKDQVVVIRNTNMLPNGAEIFRQRVTDLTGITSSSFASYLPVSNSSRSDYAISTDAALSEEKIFNAQIWNIDYDYIPTLGIQLQEGRNFAREFGQDSTGMLINETAARMMGLENPLGHNLFMPNIDGSISTYTIIGVIENFHFESLRHHIGPLCMRLGNNQGSVAFKISSTDLQGLMGQIEQRWAAMSTELPFSYHFLDESFDAMYHTEQRVGRVSMIFSILAIIIACLGLFGLTTFMVEQRVKEIGVRKVLGASVQGIITLISKDFLKLIIIAILIAMPLSWWTMNNWLANFAYRTELTWWVFASAGLLALIIALLTVSWQAIRATLTNPVDSLRDE